MIRRVITTLSLLRPKACSYFSIKCINQSIVPQQINFQFQCLKTYTKTVSSFNESKARIVLQLNLNSPNDALPFYNLPIKTLIHIYKVTKDDVRNGFCENRLYYISTRLRCSPSVLSEKIVRRTFVYSLSFDWVKNALDVLLEMGVSENRILRDLWVLKYHHETIRLRLQKVKDNGVDNLYPWMVRCSEEVLNRSINLTQETKNILGETKSTQIYLANRLNVSLESVEEMYMKTPSLKRIRVTKVKKFLDFLIKEGFAVEDIANKSRVLSASQKTVQQRLDKLRNLGINDVNLNVLCRSRKDFKKYSDSLQLLTKVHNIERSDR